MREGAGGLIIPSRAKGNDLVEQHPAHTALSDVVVTGEAETIRDQHHEHTELVVLDNWLRRDSAG
jgi:hypothetical protein